MDKTKGSQRLHTSAIGCLYRDGTFTGMGRLPGRDVSTHGTISSGTICKVNIVYRPCKAGGSVYMIKIVPL